MRVFESVDGGAKTAFEKSGCACPVDLQGKFLAVGTFGAAQGTPTAIANRRQYFFDGLVARRAKPFTNAATNHAPWRKEEIEQCLAQRRCVARKPSAHSSPCLRERYFDLIAEQRPRLRGSARGKFQHVGGAGDERTGAQWAHLWDEMHDATC